MNEGGRLSLVSLLVLAGLLLLPGFAAYAYFGETVSLWLLGECVLASLLTYYLYASDKKRARADTWRVAESTLHLWELIGGWPGAFLAQRRLRHKVSKLGYQFVFWSIVLLYHYIAADSLMQWKMTLAVKEFIRTQLAR